MRNTKIFHAENGGDGEGKKAHGKDGEDLIISVPVGTVVHNLTERSSHEITKVGERWLVAKGGQGGKGNFAFRSSINTSPKEFEYGRPGEESDIHLELKLIADIGLVGLPNAGKSSLINELTRANSKVGDYAFTTLEPHLGAYFGLIITDLPGLIEGASEGKGLGIKFLRHIERTRIIFHLVSAESKDILKDYQTIRKELERYNKKLLEKKEYLFLTKSDLAEPKDVEEKLKKLKKVNKTATAISIHDQTSMDNVKALLNAIINTV